MTKRDFDAMVARLRTIDWDASIEGVADVVRREVDRAVRAERRRVLVLALRAARLARMVEDERRRLP